MEKSALMNLDLRASLVYVRTDELPSKLTENDEFLLCFDLDPLQSRSIEPEPELLLGKQIFMGRKSHKADNLDAQPAETVSLPAGNYLFVQERRGLEREEWLKMAVEQQKDGIWEMYRPKNSIFVRFLFEDGQPVTQLFRPLPD